MIKPSKLNLIATLLLLAFGLIGGVPAGRYRAPPVSGAAGRPRRRAVRCPHFGGRRDGTSLRWFRRKNGRCSSNALPFVGRAKLPLCPDHPPASVAMSADSRVVATGPGLGTIAAKRNLDNRPESGGGRRQSRRARRSVQDCRIQPKFIQTKFIQTVCPVLVLFMEGFLVMVDRQQDPAPRQRRIRPETCCFGR